MCRKPQFPFFSFLLVTILYVYSDIVGSKDLSVHFLLCSSNLDQEFSFLLLSFDLWPRTFFFLLLYSDLWPGTFFFSFAFEAHLQLNSEWIFFLGGSFCSFFRG